MKDRDHPFFRPLWRRVGIVAFCCAWAAFEFYNKEQFWGTMAAAMAAYGAWVYLLNYKEAPKEPETLPDGDAGAPAAGAPGDEATDRPVDRKD
jgi:hypothetical protein